MRDLLEDAIVIYRQDGESLLIVAAPAIVLAPILVLIGSAGLVPALMTAPLLALLFVATYAACVRAAGLIYSNEEPDILQVYLGLIPSAIKVAWSAAPVALLFVAVSASGLALMSDGHAELALGIVLAGGLVMGHWTSRHAYEMPLLLVQDLPWEEVHDVSVSLDRSDVRRIVTLIAVIALPLLLVAFISWGFASALNPSFGAAFFAAVVGLWLPLAALVITASCERFVDEIDSGAPLPAHARS